MRWTLASILFTLATPGLASATRYTTPPWTGPDASYFGGDLNCDGFRELMALQNSGSIAAYEGLGGAVPLAPTSQWALPAPAAGRVYGDPIVADIDGDGCEDLIVDNNLAIEVHAGGPQGPSYLPTYTTSRFASSNPLNYLTGDFNDDGQADLAVGTTTTQSDGVVLVWYGPLVGMATIQDWVGRSHAFTKVVLGRGDFDGDLKEDLAWVAESNAGVTEEVYLQHQNTFDVVPSITSTLQPPNYRSSAVSIANADLDHDGIDDLITCPGASSVVIDLSGGEVPDGIPDVVLDSSMGVQTWGLVHGGMDLNEDGFTDAWVNDPEGNLSGLNLRGIVYAITGVPAFGTNFEPIVRAGPPPAAFTKADRTAAVGDVDGNGKEDLLRRIDTTPQPGRPGYPYWELVPTGSSSEDLDGDGQTGDADCDDYNPALHVGAVEVPSDGMDADCDGFELCYKDIDSDSWVSPQAEPRDSLTCSPGLGFDCDDLDPEVPDPATPPSEVFTDANCDGTRTCLADADGDGFPGSQTVASADDDCTDPGEANPLGTELNVASAIRPNPYHVPFYYQYQFTVGDFNGDGYDDLMRLSAQDPDQCPSQFSQILCEDMPKSYHVYWGSVTGLAQEAETIRNTSPRTSYALPPQSGFDLSGDGNDDIAWCDPVNVGSVWITLGPDFAAETMITDFVNCDQYAIWTAPGDFTGDGFVDLAVQERSWTSFLILRGGPMGVLSGRPPDRIPARTVGWFMSTMYASKEGHQAAAALSSSYLITQTVSYDLTIRFTAPRPVVTRRRLPHGSLLDNAVVVDFNADGFDDVLHVPITFGDGIPPGYNGPWHPIWYEQGSPSWVTAPPTWDLDVPSLPFSWTGSAAGDLDGDGYDDAVFTPANHNSGSVPAVIAGSPQGPRPRTATADFGYSERLIFGDFNGDGLSEVVSFQGYRAFATPAIQLLQDCNDQSARVHPGAVDRPGDVYDANCDGRL